MSFEEWVKELLYGAEIAVKNDHNREFMTGFESALKSVLLKIQDTQGH
jgi:hypothetical protein